MTLLTLANLVGGEAVSWVGMGYNLAVVTLGNIVSGVLMMGGAYWFVTESHEETSAAETGVTTTSPTGTDD